MITKEYLKKSYENFVRHIKDLWELITYNKSILVILILAILFLFSLYSVDTPRDFVPGTIISIEDGTTVKQAAYQLKDNNIIRSTSLFNLRVQLSKSQKIISGEYLFEEQENVLEIANRLMSGEYGVPIYTVTITEGMTVFEIAERMSSRFPRFNSENFMNLALPYEGYLFPDTYNFSYLVNEVQVIRTMRDNFDVRVADLLDDIEQPERTLHEIVTMASIVEKEATRSTIQEVSDVLWHRYNIDMLLQVDATFVYSIGKNSFTVTRREMDDETDPYNTYVHSGLPPTPISNPGLAAIRASVQSNSTDYLFFLTGRDGKMYFATDHDGHVINRRLYLD